MTKRSRRDSGGAERSVKLRHLAATLGTDTENLRKRIEAGGGSTLFLDSNEAGKVTERYGSLPKVSGGTTIAINESRASVCREYADGAAEGQGAGDGPRTELDTADRRGRSPTELIRDLNDQAQEKGAREELIRRRGKSVLALIEHLIDPTMGGGPGTTAEKVEDILVEMGYEGRVIGPLVTALSDPWRKVRAKSALLKISEKGQTNLTHVIRHTISSLQDHRSREFAQEILREIAIRSPREVTQNLLFSLRRHPVSEYSERILIELLRERPDLEGTLTGWDDRDGFDRKPTIRRIIGAAKGVALSAVDHDSTVSRLRNERRTPRSRPGRGRRRT